MSSLFYKAICTLVICLFVSFATFGQGKIAGEVVDKGTGEVIIGANISIKGGNTGGTSDLDGKYFISIAPGEYTLVVEYLGYRTMELDSVVVKDKETTYLNVVMDEGAEELKEVVVQAELKRETAEALLVQQKNMISNASGISAEQFRKLPDRTTGDILKRISGASIQDNKFAVIRGLNDRYNMAMVNGLPMPSTESDRKAFSFDLIPASLLDNMVILKTATPDLPGDFAGGVIQINTKDIPEENVQSLSIGLGSHSITTFKSGFRETNNTGNFLGMNSNGGFPKEIPDMQNYSSVTRHEAAQNSKLFNNNFTPSKIGSTRPNASFQYALGKRFIVANNPLGILLAVNYNNNLRYTSGEINLFDAPGGSKEGNFYNTNNIYRTQTLAGGILNFAYKIGQNTKLSFKNLYNISSDGFVANRSGKLVTSDPISDKLYSDTAFYFTTSRMYSGQLAGEHVFENKIKVKTILGLNIINRDVPNYKKISTVAGYDGVADDGSFTKPLLDVQQVTGLFANSSGQYFSRLKEKSSNWAVDVTLPAKILKTEFKIGTFSQLRNRDFNFIALCYQLLNNNYINLSNSHTVFTDKNFDNQNVALSFSDYSTYKANSKLLSTYVMADTRFSHLFRFIYGVRFEYFKQTVTTGNQAIAAPLENGDFLPSATLIFNVTPKMNIKLAASKTLSRPEFREVSSVQFYDFNYGSIVEGNPNLKRSQIYNMDIKYEFYPSAGEIFSISPFYKKFIDPIETVIDAANSVRKYNYLNQKGAICYGIEFEARKRFLRNFTVFVNYAFINSKVQISDIQDENNHRPLQGQSPYVINGGLQYNNEKYLFNTSLSVNRVGNRIAFQNATAKQMIWENARTIVDFQISKTFFKKLEFRYIIGDLLAQPWIFFNDLNANKKFDKNSDVKVYSYRMGITNNFSLTFKF